MSNNSVIVRYLKIIKRTIVDTQGLYRKRAKKWGSSLKFFCKNGVKFWEIGVSK